MDGNVLGEGILSDMLALPVGGLNADGSPKRLQDITTPDQQTVMLQYWQTIGKRIVSHIQQFGTVAVTIPSEEIATPPPDYTNTLPVSGTGTIS